MGRKDGLKRGNSIDLYRKKIGKLSENIDLCVEWCTTCSMLSCTVNQLRLLNRNNWL